MTESTEKTNMPMSNYWGSDQFVVDDAAPLLYSKRTIYIFSVLFSVIFGAGLLLINTRELKKHDAIVPILSFSIGYFFGIIWIIDFLEGKFSFNLPPTPIFSVLGGLLLIEIFWRKYIGRELKFRKRPIWKPTSIGFSVVIFLLIIIAIYFNTEKTMDRTERSAETNNYVMLDRSNCKVFFDPKEIREGDARGIGVVLEEIGYFRPETDMAAHLELNENTYTIFFETNEDVLTNPIAEKLFADMIQYLKKQYSESKSFKIRVYAIKSNGELIQKEYK